MQISTDSKLRSFASNSEHYTTKTLKFGAFRLCHWFCFLNGWKSLSGCWYMTKWRYFWEICLWQAFCFRNHTLRTFLESYKILLFLNRFPDGFETDFWTDFLIDFLTDFQIYWQLDFWTDFWTNLRTEIRWEFRNFLWTVFQADDQKYFWTDFQKYFPHISTEISEKIFRKNTRRLLRLNFNKKTCPNWSKFLAGSKGLHRCTQSPRGRGNSACRTAYF